MVLFSMVDERLGLPSTRTCSKKEGCHCRLTWLIMVYNLLLGAPLGGGALHKVCALAGEGYTGEGKRKKQRQEEGVFAVLLPSWHPPD